MDGAGIILGSVVFLGWYFVLFNTTLHYAYKVKEPTTSLAISSMVTMVAVLTSILKQPYLLVGLVIPWYYLKKGIGSTWIKTLLLILIPLIGIGIIGVVLLFLL
ncbi:MAG: hypothetical protein QW594_02210 [Candidatus Woesearchaeota archaeon]